MTESSFDAFVARIQDQGLFIFFFGPVRDLLFFIVIAQIDMERGILRQPLYSLSKDGHSVIGSFLFQVKRYQKRDFLSGK